MSPRTVLFSVICVVVVTETFAGGIRGCQTVGDCDCGDVCVNAGTAKRCEMFEEGCMCLAGCTVFDMYIRPGVTEQVYGNGCHCPHTLEHIGNQKERMTACTRAMWIGQPLGMRPYERNPMCDEQNLY